MRKLLRNSSKIKLKRSKSFHLKSELPKSDLLDKEEMMSSFETAFSNLDADGNGTLCENEVVYLFPSEIKKL